MITDGADFGDFVNISSDCKPIADRIKQALTIDVENDSESGLSDYDDNFAEEYRMKQEKMLGELQSIYDGKS